MQKSTISIYFPQKSKNKKVSYKIFSIRTTINFVILLVDDEEKHQCL